MTTELKRACGPVNVGDRFVLTHAAYHLLDGTQGQTKNPTELSALLLDAYQNERENEAPQEPNYIRFGYVEVCLFLQFPEVLGETVVLSFKQCQSNFWKEMGGPEITGQHSYIMPGVTSFRCPTSFYSSATTGEKLARLFGQIGPESSFIFIMNKLGQPGPVGHDMYVGLFLNAVPGAMAEGRVSLFAHTGIGDTWNMLWRMEHPEDEYRP